MAELLFWPALLAYGEAAVAYLGEARRPGSTGRLATWGVRAGWLAQTALLVVQAVRADGFPWTSWAGSLNLFVWLVIGVYLIWGCQTRYRLLGLGVMPLAAALFALAYAAGGLGSADEHRYSTVFLVVHVGLVLVAFAGFTVGAALSGLYLWQERRLKCHSTSILRAARAFAARARLVSSVAPCSWPLPAFTLGIAVGIVRLRSRGGSIDALMALTVVTWAVYGTFLLLRYGRGWHGSSRRVRRPGGLRARVRDPPRSAGGPLLMKLFLVGVSHHRAPVEVRERVALTPEQASAVARELTAAGGEAVCLSTCNRTEVYLVADEGRRAISARRCQP